MALCEEKESYAASRAGGLGGTDVAAILGLSPWKRPIDIYAGKIDPASVPEIDKELLWWGSALEPIVRERYAQRFGVEVVEPAKIADHFPVTRPWKDSTLITGKEPWMLGAPDGWIPSTTSGLEVKCSSRKSEEWGTEGSDEVPAHYLIQVAWYAAVTDAKSWNFAVLFSGNSLEQFHIPRDLELEREMIEAACSFWHDNVLKQIEPPIDESESYGKYLARKYSLATGTVINNPSPELLDAATSLKSAEDALKDAEARKQFAKNTLASLLADADKAVTPMGKIGWVRPKPSQDTDWKSLAESLTPSAELVAQFTKPRQNGAYIRAWWSK